MENALAVIDVTPVLVSETIERDLDANLADLVRKAEEAEEASREAREKAERDRDYYDGKQLTQEEFDELTKRGQPPIAFNVIRSRVDFHQGLEKRQRRDPRAWPRNPQDQAGADAFTDGLRYAVDDADYSSARSAMWKNITIEGMGGLELWVEPRQSGNYAIRVGHIPWDRLLVDPHSAKPDFSDATFIGQVIWQDADEAIAKYVGKGLDEAHVRRVVETTLRPVTTLSDTYDDRPRNQLMWTDRKRKRVKIISMWCKYPEGWVHAEYTQGGVLEETPSPYVDEEGQSYCPLILDSCYVDRDNNRYGTVRDLIDPQDEINKRRSKALHLNTMQGVVADEGAVANVNETRKELKKPDFYVQKQQGAAFEIVRNTDLAAGQAQLMATALQYVMQQGPNAALLGKGTEDQSGRAIEAQQQGGLIEHGDLLDTLRRIDWRVFRMFAVMMKQFWPAEQWVRVTDDELAPRWVGLNEPVLGNPYTGEEAPASAWAQANGGAIPPGLVPVFGPDGQPKRANDVAKLDVDIIISDAPDVVSLTGETYETVREILGMFGKVPPPLIRVMIETHPTLPTRQKRRLMDVLEELSRPAQDPAAAQADAEARQAMRAKIETDIDNTRADTEQKRANAAKAVAQARESTAKATTYLPPEPIPVPVPVPVPAERAFY